jgi:hypothetical protein
VSSNNTLDPLISAFAGQGRRPALTFVSRNLSLERSLIYVIELCRIPNIRSGMSDLVAQLKNALEHAALYEEQAARALDEFLREQYETRARFYRSLANELRVMIAEGARAS